MRRDAVRRQLFTGVNLSPGDPQPVPAARQRGREPGARARRAVSPSSGDPVIVAVHLASPVIQYLDRGKSGIALRGGDAPEYDGPDEERDLLPRPRSTPRTTARSRAT